MSKKILILLITLLLVGTLAVTGFAQQVISVQYGEPWKDLFESAIVEFEKTTGAKVDRMLIPYGVDVWEKIALDFAAGVASDVLMVDGFMIADTVEADYVYKLDGYVKEWPDWDQYYPAFQAMGSYQGHVYGITLETAANAVLWYWIPNFEKAGIPMPWKPKDWDEVLETAERIKESLPDVEYPLYIPMGTKWGEGATCCGIYSQILGADTSEGDRNRLWNYTTRKWIGSSPAIERALNFYREVFFVRKLSPTEAMYAPDVWGEWRRLMREGKMGIGQGGSWEWAEFWPEAIRPPEEQRADFLGLAPLPGSGDPGTPPIQTISGGWTVAMKKEVKNPDLAWEFLRILNSKERLAKWLGAAGKLSMRKDSAEIPEYGENEFLREIGKLLPYSTYRDAVAGYTTVSYYVQQAMEKVAVDGLSAAEAMEWYKNKLIEEFGKDKVETIK
jgi:multiple sugar transport system substrate-binding protein